MARAQTLFKILPDRLSRAGTGLLAFAVTLIYTGLFQTTGLFVIGQGLVTVQPVVALLAVVGLLGGPVAVVGSVLGYVGFQASQGSVPVWQSVEYLVFGVLVHLFGSQTGTTDVRNPLGSIGQLVVFALVVGTSAFGSASFVGWSRVVVGQSPFFPTVVISGVSQAISGVLGGLLVLEAVRRVVESRRWQSVTGLLSGRARTRRESLGWLPLSAGLLFAWVVAGSVIGMGFEIFELVPPAQVGRRGFEQLLLFTESGRLSDADYGLQFATGVTALTLWVISLRRYGVLSRRYD